MLEVFYKSENLNEIDSEILKLWIESIGYKWEQLTLNHNPSQSHQIILKQGEIICLLPKPNQFSDSKEKIKIYEKLLTFHNECQNIKIKDINFDELPF